MGLLTVGARCALLLLACAGGAVACSNTVTGSSRVQAPGDASAPKVAPADLTKLLLSDQQVSDIVGAPGMVSFEPYQGIPPPAGETYSEPRCAEAVFNTEWPSYNGTGFTGAVGHKVGEPGDRPAHNIDEGVVSFPDAVSATRFVVRTGLDFDRCADTHFSFTTPPPRSQTDYYTIGFPKTVGDMATVVSAVEGGEGRTCARAISSRSNVVIDVYVCATDATAKTAVDLVNAIANNVRH
jgi:serine/threonine-protein kinase